MTRLFDGPEFRSRRPMITIGVSAAGVTALVVALAHLNWPSERVSATTAEDIRKALEQHQASMVLQVQTEQAFLERIEKLLRVMCVQQAKDGVARAECLR